MVSVATIQLCCYIVKAAIKQYMNNKVGKDLAHLQFFADPYPKPTSLPTARHVSKVILDHPNPSTTPSKLQTSAEPAQTRIAVQHRTVIMSDV